MAGRPRSPSRPTGEPEPLLLAVVDVGPHPALFRPTLPRPLRFFIRLTGLSGMTW
jgi:hypothetical protein